MSRPVESRPAERQERRPTPDKTVREVLPPWHVLEDKLKGRAAATAARAVSKGNDEALAALAAQEAANAQWVPGNDAVEVPPSSGVRVSEPGPEPTPQPWQEGADPGSPLTFKVYTLAELERRSDAPVSMRMSMASFDTTASRGPVPWRRALIALRAFGVAALAWAKTKKAERPDPKVALRGPFDALGDELQVAVESIDWKRLGVTTGIIVGATLTILFAVLTAAELTDDLKPGASAHLASAETSLPSAKTAPDARSVAPATNMAAMGVQPVTPVPSALAIAAAPAPVSVGEVDDPEPPAPKRLSPVGAKKPAKPRGAKLGYRSPDAVFNP